MQMTYVLLVCLQQVCNNYLYNVMITVSMLAKQEPTEENFAPRASDGVRENQHRAVVELLGPGGSIRCMSDFRSVTECLWFRVMEYWNHWPL